MSDLRTRPPSSEQGDLQTAFENANSRVKYAPASNPDNPDILNMPGEGQINLKPVKFDAKTLETPFAKLMRKMKQEPIVPICTSGVWRLASFCLETDCETDEIV